MSDEFEFVIDERIFEDPEIMMAFLEAELFEGVGEDEIRLLSTICSKRIVPQGENLLEQGERNETLYFLGRGEMSVLIEAQQEGAPSIEANRVGPGSLLGEYSFIDHWLASATVRAVEECEVIEIGGDDLRGLLEQNDRIGRIVYQNLLGILVRRLRGKDELDGHLADARKSGTA